MTDQTADNLSTEHGGAIDKPAVSGSVFFKPKNNWIMAEALRDGLTCRIRSKHMADVLTALDYHNIRAVIDQEDDEFMLVIPHCHQRTLLDGV